MTFEPSPDRAPWRAGRLVGLGAGAATALASLVALGGAVPGPPWVSSAPRWASWASTVGPGGVVMALVRVLALAAAGYLLAVVVIELVGRGCAAPALLRASHGLCLPGMASWLSQAAAAGLVVSIVTGSALAAGPAGATGAPATRVVMHQLTSTAAGRADPPPVMQVIGSPPTAPPIPTAPSTPGPPPSTTAPPPSTTAPPVGSPAAASPTTSTTSSPPGSHVPVTPDARPTAAVPPAAATTWTIRPGDHLWRVASTTLAQAWTTRPTDAEVLAYLHALIAANRDRLVVRTDPDLVYPGQVFGLPPVPPRPA